MSILISCSSGSSGSHDRKSEQNSEPAVSDIPRITAAADLRLPLQDYLLDDRQLRDLDRARVVLIDRCMRGFGFTYAVRQPDADHGPRSATERRYGITDAADAAAYGYGLGERDPALQKPPPRPVLRADAETVLFGKGRSSIKGRKVPEGGCMTQADRSLGPAAPAGTDPGLPQQLSFRAFDLSRADSRVRAAIRAWSACMARGGHDYADPLAPLADPALTGRTDRQAIATATADIRCKRRTNLVGVWFTVESAYQKRLIDRNTGELDAVRAANKARLRAAGGIGG
ncbi:hypothetical protein [Streptomyces sp. NPDC053367]|uniref:hypothetical protein n=1 Tax=Streptomyces sp. NPDC053367 TaxID=3365700 RepID=UPI0037CEA861